MAKYFITYDLSKNKNKRLALHAGVKANEDVFISAKQQNYQPLFVTRYNDDGKFTSRILNHVYCYFSWKKTLKKIKSGDVVFIQVPDCRMQLGSKCAIKKISKKAKLICLVHDIESLRTPNVKRCKKFENLIFSSAHVIIVHNEKMKDYCISQGVDEEKLVSLDLFDYFCEEGNLPEQGSDVVLAGNLVESKSPYVGQLDKLDFNVQLFGIGYSKGDSSNIHYNGAVPAEKLPNLLCGKFGLVWDGTSVDKCDGVTGLYMRYNNPHKTSLYLCAGLPVIVWEESAIATFVKKSEVGITVNSLWDVKPQIDAMTDEDYKKMRNNAKDIAEKVRSGYFTKTAVKKAEEILKV